MSPRRVALYVASLALQTWLATFLEKPGQVLAGAYLLELITLLLLIEGMYRGYHTTGTERVRARLRSLVTSPAQAGISGPIGTASLFGCMVVVFAFFWPFAFYASAALKQEAPWVIVISLAFITRQLLSGGIVMDFSHGKELNFGYNLKWVFTLLFMVIVGFVMMFGASVANVFDLIPEDRGARYAEVLIAFVVLASQHIVDFLVHVEAMRPSRAPETTNAG